MVKIRVYGVFRKISGIDEMSVSIGKEPMSLKTLLDELRHSFPEFFRALIDSELSDPRPNALILINGKEIGVMNGLETLINDKDEVVVIPVSHGG
ncbi:MAG: MoaD/ThiS family protein [Candidatus Bathyarchaeia archaeon]